MPPDQAADANDPQLTVAGKAVYAAQCAGCHGRYLQGQPMWRLADPDQHRRAPALNATGRAWQHSDNDLFAVIRDGHFPGIATTPESRMPAFGDRLRDADIMAVMAFIKGRWPTSLRVVQTSLNPTDLGRPRDADGDWRLPPDCKP